MIDLSPLHNAIAQLGLGLDERKRQPHSDFIRDALIQRFKFTYELSHKMLRRYLSETEADDLKELSFANLIRLASERGLMLNGWDKWHAYRDARNQTSHAYDKAKADAVVAIIPDFTTMRAIFASRWQNGKMTALNLMISYRDLIAVSSLTQFLDPVVKPRDDGFTGLRRA